MRQISDQEFREAIAATKKDAALVAAAKNDRLNSPENLYKEFEKLPVERRRDIIISIASEQFVAAQWKIAFPLNNFPADLLSDAVVVAGKALFFTREESSLREVLRTVRIYQKSPFVKMICGLLGEAAESTGLHVERVAEIVNSPEVYGIFRQLEGFPSAERIVTSIVKVATYAKDFESTIETAKFLSARRYSPYLNSICSLVENAVFMAREPAAVKAIIRGLSAGSIDVVLQTQDGNQKVLSEIQSFAWKRRDWKAIRDYLQVYLQ